MNHCTAGAPGWRATLPAVTTWRPAMPSCPTTIAWGERDRLLLYGRQAPRARRWLPEARHVTLDGLGHVPTYDDPEQVARGAWRPAMPGCPTTITWGERDRLLLYGRQVVTAGRVALQPGARAVQWFMCAPTGAGMRQGRAKIRLASAVRRTGPP